MPRSWTPRRLPAVQRMMVDRPDDAAGPAAITAGQLIQVAHDWGYEGRVQTAGGPAASLATGRLESVDIDSGAQLFVGELLTQRSHRLTAQVPRGLLVQVTLDGPAPDWGLADERQASAIAAVSDGTLEICQSRESGQRHRLLVLQVAVDAALADAGVAERLRQLVQRPRVVQLDVGVRLAALADELVQPCADAGVHRLLARSFGLELLARALQTFAREHDNQALAACRPALRRSLEGVRDRLTADPGADYSLTDLARQAGMSPTTLKLRFAEAFGCSVFEFLRRLRLQRAHLGLRFEGWSVKQAALHCGYRHPANFATAYRRHFGCSPSEVARPLA